MIEKKIHFITETIEKEITDRITYKCDRCGQELHQDCTDEESTKVQFKSGYNYGNDGYSIDRLQAYFCPDCSEWLKKLMDENKITFTNEHHED